MAARHRVDDQRRRGRISRVLRKSQRRKRNSSDSLFIHIGDVNIRQE
ncbi:hypothetical protein EYF80_062542 [Liparis tanakae]|uniref:Uncharacterized protein n=1 Tax=Liparis tanakae TaxID=230148 RepID=A0A4Z2EFS0_9TELE|nr:hypothetical protein EYF80_062542 [Liparis tanakae]